MANGTFEGTDLPDAIATASRALGIPAADLHYEIVEQGRRGVLGFGAKSVQIRVKPPLDDGHPTESEAPPPPPSRKRSTKSARSARSTKAAVEPSGEVSAEAEAVATTVRKIVELMGFELDVQPRGGNGVTLALDGPDRKRLVGRKGEVLSAMQLLVNRMARRAWPDVRRVTLECDGKSGGRGRDDDLVQRVRDLVAQVEQTGRTCRTGPLNSYERRLVHLTVRESSGLSSSSEGNGANKRVRISRVRNSIE